MKPLLTFLFMLIPALVQAEGAKQSLDCQASKICNDAGICQPSAETVTFTLEPLRAGGSFMIEYNGMKSDMQNVTSNGPFVWIDTDGNLQTLLPAGNKSVLWHRLNSGIPPTSSIQFLTCEDAS